MLKPKINDQSRALTNIENKIFFLATPKDVNTTVPPIGVKISGVKKAIPQMPNFFHTLMVFLVRLENFFDFFLIMMVQFFLNHSPKNVNKITEVIIPDTVTKIISTKL